jgi:hypothetical protein
LKVAEPYQRKSAVSICGNLREKWDLESGKQKLGIWPRGFGVEFGIRNLGQELIKFWKIIFFLKC